LRLSILSYYPSSGRNLEVERVVVWADKHKTRALRYREPLKTWLYFLPRYTPRLLPTDKFPPPPKRVHSRMRNMHKTVLARHIQGHRILNIVQVKAELPILVHGTIPDTDAEGGFGNIVVLDSRIVCFGLFLCKKYTTNTLV